MSLIDLEKIDRFVVRASVYDETIRALRAAGGYGVECVVVWAGFASGNCFCFDTVYCPRQFATVVGSRVDAEDVDNMYMRLFRSQKVAAAQVHSHPGAAFHSDTDDDFSLVSRCGALSLVVPNFAFEQAADISNWAGFRLDSKGWVQIDPLNYLILEEL